MEWISSLVGVLGQKRTNPRLALTIFGPGQYLPHDVAPLSVGKVLISLLADKPVEKDYFSSVLTRE